MYKNTLGILAVSPFLFAATVAKLSMYLRGSRRKKFHSVMANVVAEIDLELLEPIYKQFPDLRPAGLDAIKD